MTITFVPQSISVSVDQSGIGISTGTPIARDYIEHDPYTGGYEITPSAETQTLLTNGLRMTDNVVVNPIPSSYGHVERVSDHLVLS